MAVTVKTVKKKKPLTLKKNTPPGEAAEGADGQAAEGTPAGAAPAASPAAAAAQAPAAPIKKPSYTFAGICAILEFLMFAAVLTLQIIEWRYYEAPPKNAFPPYGIGPEDIPIPSTTSLIEKPATEAEQPLDEGIGEDVVEEEVSPLDESVPIE